IESPSLEKPTTYPATNTYKTTTRLSRSCTSFTTRPQPLRQGNVTLLHIGDFQWINIKQF
ncbi:hypothetical protein CHS0354_003870, partial [Potamilus streckersoni]